MREGALSLGRLLGAPPGGVGSAWTWSGSPAVVRRARLQGWVVAADPPHGLPAHPGLSCRPLTTLVSDLVSALAMSRSFCARAATPEMRAISTLPVSTSHSRAKTLLRR